MRPPKGQLRNRSATERGILILTAGFLIGQREKSKASVRQNPRPKETFLVLDFYLCIAVLRGRDVSEMHPPFSVFREAGRAELSTKSCLPSAQ